jgi:hypothetical protein
MATPEPDRRTELQQNTERKTNEKKSFSLFASLTRGDAAAAAAAGFEWVTGRKRFVSNYARPVTRGRERERERERERKRKKERERETGREREREREKKRRLFESWSEIEETRTALNTLCTCPPAKYSCWLFTAWFCSLFSDQSPSKGNGILLSL